MIGSSPGSDTDNNRLGALLHDLRTSRRLGQERAAQAGGIHRVTLHRWEQGATQPRLPEIESYLQALDVGPRQKRQILALINAPRARALTQTHIACVAAQANLGPLPHGGDLLRAMRLRAMHGRGGHSLEEVASRSGVTTRTVRRWEKAEVWPSIVQLHSLCRLLCADAEEVAALTCGRFTLIPAQENLSAEAIRHRLSQEQDSLTELGMLTLEASAWPMAARGDEGRYLLAEIYAVHAHFLSNRRRFPESERYAERALEILSKKPTPERIGMYAVLASARAAVFRGPRPAPAQGVELLRRWLPWTPWPEFKAWMLNDLGEYQMLLGESENALFLSRRACEIAAQSENPTELHMREVDQARLLLKVALPEKALPFLQIQENTHPGYQVEVSFLRVEAHLAIGDHSQAQDCLQRANQEIEAHDLIAFRPRAASLALRF